MPRIIKSAKGTFTAATITVDGQGRVVAASSGSAGGKGFVFAVGASNNETVTYTASPLATGDIYGALIGGGGGGGTGGSGGGNGGKGGFGVFFGASPSGPYNNTDAVAGAAGTAGPANDGVGNSGSASSFGNLATGNGGQGGFGFNNTGGNAGSFSTNLTSLSNFASPSGVGIFGGLNSNINPNRQPGQNPTSVNIANLFPQISRSFKDLGEGGQGSFGANSPSHDGGGGAVVIFEGQ